jgi:hypothetical protein
MRPPRPRGATTPPRLPAHRCRASGSGDGLLAPPVTPGPRAPGPAGRTVLRPWPTQPSARRDPAGHLRRLRHPLPLASRPGPGPGHHPGYYHQHHPGIITALINDPGTGTAAAAALPPDLFADLMNIAIPPINCRQAGSGLSRRRSFAGFGRHSNQTGERSRFPRSLPSAAHRCLDREPTSSSGVCRLPLCCYIAAETADKAPVPSTGVLTGGSSAYRRTGSRR